MSTQAVNSVSAGTTQASSTRSDRTVTGMNSEDFFKLLITELRQQDPLEPAKTSDMIGQVSQIRSIELSRQLTDTLGSLSRQQHTNGASELLGKYVTATLRAEDGSEQDVMGIVTGVRFDADGTAVLELDSGQAVLASDVTHIAGAENAPRNRTTTAQAGTAATGTTAATTSPADANTDKTDDTAKQSGGGLFPWLSLSGSFSV